MNRKDARIVIRSFVLKYASAKKKEKGSILSHLEFVTGYHRKRIIHILTHSLRRRKIKRHRPSSYLPVLKQLKILWAVSNYSCGQRLKPMIPLYLSALKRHKELLVTAEEKTMLLKISSATIDRLLKHDRKLINIKGRSRTKPGSLLKSQIPIKMWTDWDKTKPAF